ncbi:hypothetical protein HNR02_005665 [Amycolatopsis endophytica]|uniref:Uncharacterized protein n=1 Tax=Amycolatopsis endophytica TaxID=860233 RepID=A0A853BB94_9PSEU|nr:hypothetical protein [Amycolatopsis endophytica]NYI92290.1 hypothetical protein [Amycolatopsis endophytica]
MFTTRGEKGGNVTRVPPGVALQPMRGGFVLLVAGLALAAGAVIAGIGLVFVSLAEGFGPASWWWLALGVPATALTIFLLAGVYVTGTELIMRENPRNLIIAAALLGGTVPGLGALSIWWFWRGSDIVLHPELIDYPGWNRELIQQGLICGAGSAAAAIGCLVLALIAVRGARRARRDVARILRLRATGGPRPGIIIALPDPATWNHGGDVPIRYQDDSGGERTIRVRLNTYAHEIPVPGTPVIVFTDGDDLLVELDSDHPVEYHPDNRPYESDTSGGGS